MSPGPPPIFINYRRTKTRDKALILRWILEKEFSAGVSFLDRESIDPGKQWRAELKQAIEQCHVLLALIHKDWHKDQEPSGSQCLREPNDWIRQAIATALGAGKVVIPLLIDRAYLSPGGTDLERSDLPPKTWLPEEIEGLFERQAFRLRFDSLTPAMLDDFLSHVRAVLPAPWSEGTSAMEVAEAVASSLAEVEERV